MTYYRWRQEFGGLKSDQVKRLKDLEPENSRLRKAVSDLTLDKLILAGGCQGKLLSPARRRACIEHLRQSYPSPSAAPARRSVSIARRSAKFRKAVTTKSG